MERTGRWPSAVPCPISSDGIHGFISSKEKLEKKIGWIKNPLHSIKLSPHSNQ
jgi:hypothetical protein